MGHYVSNCEGERGLGESMMHRFMLRLCALSVWGGCAGAAPLLLLREVEHDFGEIEDTGRIEHTFELRNAGDAPLRIVRLKPSCTCTLVALPAHPLGPGETLPLKVSLELKGLQGPVRKSILLESNDPQRRRTFLWLSGRVRRELYLEPAALNFGVTGTATSLVRRVEVRSLKDDVWIERVQCEQEMLSVGPVDDARRSFNVTLHPPRSAILELGVVQGSVSVSVTGGVTRTLSLPVAAYLQAPLTFIPGRLDLSRDPGADTALILLRPGTIEAFGVTAVEVPPGVTAAVQTVEQGGYRIQLAGLRVPPGATNVLVHVATDVPGFERVPVSIAVRR